MPQIESNGFSLYYEESGQGSPLLLIAGFGSDVSTWEPLLPQLSRRHRVVCFDNRGAGRSGLGRPPYSMTQLAADALAVLDALQIARAAVFGVSMGGMVAQHLALQAPERISALVLACTTPGGPAAQGAAPQVMQRYLASFGLPLEEEFEARLPIMYSDEFAALNRAALFERAHRNAHLHAAQAGVQGQVAAIRDHDASARLHEITAPTLVLHGDDDPLIPPRNGLALAEGIAGARLLLYPARHLLHVEQLPSVVTDVLAFLDRAEGEARTELDRPAAEPDRSLEGIEQAGDQTDTR